MSVLEQFILTFTDTFMGHMALSLYLFAVTDERDVWKRIKRLPPLLLSPFIATLSTYGMKIVIPSLSLSRYFITSLLILLMCTIWMMWAWQINFWRAFSSICMAGILQIATSTLVQVLFLFLPLETLWHLLISMIPYFALVLAATLLLKKLHFGTYFQMLMEDDANLPRTTALIFALELTMDTFLVFQSGVELSYLTGYYFMVIVLIMLIISLIAYLGRHFDARRRLQAQQDIIAQQQLYEKSLEQIRKEVRSFRHDYKNLLAGLSAQAGDGAFEELNRSLTELDAGFDRSLGEKIQASTQIGNLLLPPVRSLFLNKLTAMQEKGVDCHLEVLYPVETVNMDVWDFVRCLGILLDNAIEAAQETDPPWVEILLLSRKDQLSLRISNSWKETAEPDKIWMEGWTTKGNGRGIGLPGYQRILKSYPHAIPATSWENGVFVQELTIGGRL